MTTVTGIQLSEYLKLDPRSPYTFLFQRIYEITKPKAFEDIEDGEIEEVEEVEDKDDSVIVEDVISDDENKENVGAVETRKKFSKDILQWTPESNHQNQNIPAAKLPHPHPQPHPPPLMFGLPPPMTLGLPHPLSLAATSQFNPSLFTAPPPPVSAGLRLPFSFPQLDFRHGFPGFAIPSNPSMSVPLVPSVSGRESLLPLPPLPQLGGMQPMYSEAPDEVEFREAKGFDLKVLVDLDHDPVRLTWLVDYTKFMAKMGKPLTQCPSMYKEPLDLYRLYHVVQIEGGFEKVTMSKSWKNISQRMTKNFRQPYLWRLLQKQYVKYLLAFETYDQIQRQPRPNVFSRPSVSVNPVDDPSQPIDMIISSR